MRITANYAISGFLCAVMLACLAGSLSSFGWGLGFGALLTAYTFTPKNRWMASLNAVVLALLALLFLYVATNFFPDGQNKAFGVQLLATFAPYLFIPLAAVWLWHAMAGVAMLMNEDNIPA